mmetsp:Transcript_20079/g.31407  ORF Transcript_20079/g.31407 Transcript_20079/m.31407 type:complete len:162 (+) Transcript_20079:1185-1670(+)
MQFGDFVPLFAAFIFRLGRQVDLELETYSLVSVLLYGNLLNLLFPFKYFGMLLISIHHMLVGDVFTSLMVFLILLVGFSQATFVLLQKSSLAKWGVMDRELYESTCSSCDSDWTVISSENLWLQWARWTSMARYWRPRIRACCSCYTSCSLLSLLFCCSTC